MRSKRLTSHDHRFYQLHHRRFAPGAPGGQKRPGGNGPAPAAGGGNHARPVPAFQRGLRPRRRRLRYLPPALRPLLWLRIRARPLRYPLRVRDRPALAKAHPGIQPGRQKRPKAAEICQTGGRFSGRVFLARHPGSGAAAAPGSGSAQRHLERLRNAHEGAGHSRRRALQRRALGILHSPPGDLQRTAPPLKNPLRPPAHPGGPRGHRENRPGQRAGAPANGRRQLPRGHLHHSLRSRPLRGNPLWRIYPPLWPGR